MYNGQKVSLDQILWKVIGRGGLYDDLNPEDAALYAMEALRMLGAPLIYTNKVTNPPLSIVAHKAKLPSDLIEIRGVRLITNDDNFNDCPIALNYATDIYHDSPESCDSDESLESNKHPLPYPKEYTYTTGGGVITTSFSEGKIQISYKSLDTCEDGYPTLPNDMDTLFAIEYHIRWRFLEPLWEVGKISDKAYNNVVQNRDWYMGAAQSGMQLAGIDQLESVMNAVNRLILPTGMHQVGFRRLGIKENIRKFS